MNKHLAAVLFFGAAFLLAFGVPLWQHIETGKTMTTQQNGLWMVFGSLTCLMIARDTLRIALGLQPRFL